MKTTTITTAQLLEAGKKRIKGNLCTGPGGFQACSPGGGFAQKLIQQARVRGLIKKTLRKSDAAARPALSQGAFFNSDLAGGSARAGKLMTAAQRLAAHNEGNRVPASFVASMKAKSSLISAHKRGGDFDVKVRAVRALYDKVKGDPKLSQVARAQSMDAVRSVATKYMRATDLSHSYQTTKYQMGAAGARKKWMRDREEQRRKASLFGESLVEAGKKRIKGNLCTGSGGFQACSPGGSSTKSVADRRATVAKVTSKYLKQLKKQYRDEDHARNAQKLGFTGIADRAKGDAKRRAKVVAALRSTEQRLTAALPRKRGATVSFMVRKSSPFDR